MRIANHQGVDANPAHDSVGHAPHHAVLDRAHSQRPHQDEVVVRIGDVVDQALPVLAVEGLVLEGKAGPIAGSLHHVEVGVGDQLKSAGDQRVMNLPLAFELLLVLVLLGERVLHLLEAHVVHAGGIDVAADQPGSEATSQRDGHLDRRIGMVRVVEGHIDLLVHQELPSLHWRDRLN